MCKLKFSRCKICGCIFYHGSKTVYCDDCVPSCSNPNTRAKKVYEGINNRQYIEERRKRERERWHRRMSNPKFREAERIRSLARARNDKRYARLGGEE